MATRSVGWCNPVVAVVSCGFLLIACGADRGDVAADATTEPSAAEQQTTTPGRSTTTATMTTSTVTTSTVAAPTSTIATSTVITSTITTSTVTAVPEPDETATAETVPPDPEDADTPTEATGPTLEVVGDQQTATDRVPPGQSWTPFATFADVTLVHPSIRVERIGFHESNHDGARQLEPTATAIAPVVLDSRQRDTGSRTAADIVVEPGTEIRAPVTGTVLRAGGYVLYCDHQDDFLVIEPDSHPGWEVKLLHINGVLVSAGDRVEAGVTVVAPEATVLPFDSQVDKFTATPPWPHVHIELVDPSIPDRPSTGGGC